MVKWRRLSITINLVTMTNKKSRVVWCCWHLVKNKDGSSIFAVYMNDICCYPQATFALCNVGSNARLVQTECSLVPTLIWTLGKHCKCRYETRLYIALLKPCWIWYMKYIKPYIIKRHVYSIIHVITEFHITISLFTL